MRMSFIAALIGVVYCFLPGAASAQMTGPGSATPPECARPADQEQRDACHAAIASCFWTAGAPAQAVNGDANAAIRKCVRKALRAGGYDRDDGTSLRNRCADSSDADELIQACTVLINRRDGTTKERSQYYTFRGTARLQKYSYAAGIDDLTQAIQNDPDNGKALVSRSFGFMAEKRYDRALADLNQAVAIAERQGDHDTQAEALYFRGGLKVKYLGRTAEGDQDIAHARAINPNVEN